MNIKGRLEKVAGRVEIVAEGAPCAECTPLVFSLARVLGGFAPLTYTPGVFCAELRTRLEQAYGGGNDDGLKAAA
jgi:hypothetical protein